MARRDDDKNDDAALWTHVARTVAPLKRRRAVRKPEAPKQEPEKPARPAKPPRPMARVPVAPPPATAPELAAGAAPGLDRRTATRLRRGKLAVEGRIDLHGMTRDQAADTLGRFLRSAQARGKRCVLVITGKGLRGEKGGGETGGVIRAELPRWLNGAGLRPIVVAFAQAQPGDGGAGAFYVYLKRERER